MSGIVNSTGAVSGVIGTTVGTPSAGEDEINFVAYGGSGTVSIANSAKVPFSSVSQSGSAWSSNTFTVPVAGYYWFSISVYNYSGAATYAWDIREDSTHVIARWYGTILTGGSISSTASGGKTLAKDDTVSLHNTSGGARNIYLSSMDHTHFCGVLINAT